MIVPTVKVKPWGKGQGEFVEINETDFDPKVHVAFGKPAAPVLTTREINADLEAKGVEFDPRESDDKRMAQRNEARAKRPA